MNTTIDSTTLGISSGGTAATIIALYLILKFLIIPKLNTVCVRTSRMEVAQTVLIDVVAEDHPEQDLRGRICDEIDRLGLPRQDYPIKPL